MSSCAFPLLAELFSFVFTSTTFKSVHFQNKYENRKDPASVQRKRKKKEEEQKPLRVKT